MSEAKSEALAKLELILGAMTRLGAEVADLHSKIDRLKAAPAAAPRSAAGGGGMMLPNYGRAKGQPIKGASPQDLEFYANGARRSLADPEKARWHEKEAALLAAIEAELGGDGPPPGDGGPPSDDLPF